jgi:hypothetical protein
LIAAIKAASEFTTLSEKIQKNYRRHLRLIEEEFGTMPLAAVEHRKARGEFRRWRDTLANRTRVADYAWTVLARVLAAAKDNGTILRTWRAAL